MQSHVQRTKIYQLKLVSGLCSRDRNISTDMVSPALQTTPSWSSHTWMLSASPWQHRSSSRRQQQQQPHLLQQLLLLHWSALLLTLLLERAPRKQQQLAAAAAAAAVLQWKMSG
jgi:hypothetical protein